MASTQFESVDARRCFPCWDEPRRKATFTCALKCPSHMTALSNMPESRRKDHGDGFATTSFMVSPRMSTYLLCFVVGIYWMMRSLKDSVFATLVGLEYQPQAKMLSLFVVTAVLFAYNKVVDLVERNRLLAVICGSYALVFVAIAVCLKSTSFGLYGDDGAPLPPSPERLLGWVHYFAIESYGSLAVSLFWQWTNSIVDLKAAKAQKRAAKAEKAEVRRSPRIIAATAAAPPPMELQGGAAPPKKKRKNKS